MAIKMAGRLLLSVGLCTCVFQLLLLIFRSSKPNLQQSELDATLVLQNATIAKISSPEVTAYSNMPSSAKTLYERQNASSNATNHNLSFLSIGDWGVNNESRARVALTMAAVGAAENVSFIIALGDNFYPRGVASAESVRWLDEFENSFNQPALRHLIWYPVLGNHDHDGNATAQIAYSKKSQRWYMPSRYYRSTFRMSSSLDTQTDLCVVFLDTLGLLRGDEQQWQWLEKVLIVSQQEKSLVIVVGHEPVFSVGEHVTTQLLQSRLSEMFNKYRINSYICGHNHALEHHRVQSIDYFVNGVGCSIPENAPRMKPLDSSVGQTLFAERHLGFLLHQVTHGTLVTTFYAANGKKLHKT